MNQGTTMNGSEIRDRGAIHPASRDLLANMLVSFIQVARRARDDAELQRALERDFNLSIPQQRDLALLDPGLLRSTTYASQILRMHVQGDCLAIAHKLQAQQLAENALIDALIVAGATRGLMMRWFGLPGSTFTARRRVLDLPQIQGRPKEVDDPDSIRAVMASWNRHNAATEAEHCLVVAQDTGQSVGTVFKIAKDAGLVKE